MAKKARPDDKRTAPTPSAEEIAAAHDALTRCGNCGHAREDHALHDQGLLRCPTMWRGVTFYR